MQMLRMSLLVLMIGAVSLPAWSQEAAPSTAGEVGETGEAAIPAEEEDTGPTSVVVIASGGANVTEVVLSQARSATVATVSRDQGRHGRVTRREEDPGLTARAAECEDNECFSAVTRDAQARYLFVVLVNRSDSGFQASVMLVDAEAGQIVGSAALDLPPDPTGFGDAMGEPFGPLLSAIAPIGPTTGRLIVTADQVGAAVLVDGERVGSTPLEPLEGIEIGEHRVQIVIDGFQDFVTMVDVPAGGEATVQAELAPSMQEAVVVEPPLWRRWWFWTIVGGAVVVTGTAVGLGVGLSQSSGSNQEWGVPFPSYE